MCNLSRGLRRTARGGGGGEGEIVSGRAVRRRMFDDDVIDAWKYVAIVLSTLTILKGEVSSTNSSNLTCVKVLKPFIMHFSKRII